jgi:hypothetical protein
MARGLGVRHTTHGATWRASWPAAFQTAQAARPERGAAPISIRSSRFSGEIGNVAGYPARSVASAGISSDRAMQSIWISCRVRTPTAAVCDVSTRDAPPVGFCGFRG